MLLPPLLLACTASHWRIADPAPWGSESTMFQHDELEKMALNACPLTQDEMLSPKFVSNGCSVWPDAKNYLGCCVQHDLAYWCGGSVAARREADRDLRQCVTEHSSGLNAWLMYLGVRLGGHPLWPMSWRWGFGRHWRGRYWDSPQQAVHGKRKQTNVTQSRSPGMVASNLDSESCSNGTCAHGPRSQQESATLPIVM